MFLAVNFAKEMDWKSQFGCSAWCIDEYGWITGWLMAYWFGYLIFMDWWLGSCEIQMFLAIKSSEMDIALKLPALMYSVDCI